MVKFRMKVLVTLSLIVSLLMLNTGFTSFANEKELTLSMVEDAKEIDNVLKNLSQNKGFNDFSDLNYGQLKKHFMGMALVPEKDVYVFAFEHVEKKENQDKTGWSLTVVYDFNNNELIDATFGVVTEDTITVNNKVKNKEVTRSKEVFEKDQKAFNKEDCGCVGSKVVENKSGIAAVVDNLLSTPKAEAAMSESEKCGWSSVVMCAVLGVITGGWGGFICSATMMYMCTYVPLA
ncbi:hypothetical protein [Paenibacillus harenae]|uniref:hypothetical protein n=1 Tax=Paenibacillus harenae TaxID=306543 RepID=UPI00048EF932|nr:hypothetical protein [Paenibacillus harenae]